MITTTIETLILIYSLLLILMYTILVLSASRKLMKHSKQKELNNPYLLLNSPLQPSISIVASCYNEAFTVCDCVGALMRLEYDDYEIIVVNDGSTDQTLSILIDNYELYLTDKEVPQLFDLAPIRGVYRSRNKTWYNLTIIDKENGGKADAINAGISLAKGEYLINIDVDSVIVPDALTKLMMPVMQAKEAPVVAVGGSIGIANGCKIVNGVIVEKRVPKNFLASIQIVEYARAFLIGRMGWAGMNALLLVSGALGAFRRDLVVEVGGYQRASIGEDLELITRIRCYLIEKKMKHRVEYVPDVLLWTEAPSSFRTLYRQRVRWAKGLISMLIMNWRVILNPAYGRIGLLSFPYWILYEWMAPFIELGGVVYLTYTIIADEVNWLFFIFITTFIFLFGGVISVVSIGIDELVNHSYYRKRDLIILFLRGVTELLFFHPFVSMCAIIGNIQYLLGNKGGWGVMTRKGFSKN